MNNIVFTVKDLALYLRVSESTIRKLIKEKKIPHYRIFSKILFKKELIDKWLSDNEKKNYII